MYRRPLLGTITTGIVFLAGCTSGGPDDTTSEAATTGAYSVSVIPAADDLPVTLDAEVRAGTLTDPDTPLTVAVTVENQTDESVAFGERRSAQFMQRQSQSPTDDYVLLPPAWLNDDVYGFDAGAWVRRRAIATTDDYQTETLDAGDTTTAELYLLVDAVQTEPAAAVPDTFPDELVFETQIDTTTATEDAAGPMDTNSSWGLRFTL